MGGQKQCTVNTAERCGSGDVKSQTPPVGRMDRPGLCCWLEAWVLCVLVVVCE